MAVITQEMEEEEVESSTMPVNSRVGSGTETATTKHADDLSDSDGFETASERDVSELNDEENKIERLSEQGILESGDCSGDTHAVESVCDTETQQKLLDEATDAKQEGNLLFGQGKYEEALLKYDAALTLAKNLSSSEDLLAVCHSNRGVCYLKLGRHEDTVKECSKALDLNPGYLKALTRRAEAREKLENFEEAIADLKKVLELEPTNENAARSIRRLEPLAAAKREKMKEEMIGKLKEMGNSVLGRFGMSLDNFKAVQDPNTGSYSISFNK